MASNSKKLTVTQGLRHYSIDFSDRRYVADSASYTHILIERMIALNHGLGKHVAAIPPTDVKPYLLVSTI